ncbi:MAG: zinc-binding dehydrogenase [Deltaproteobacteria bacterium]|nr:zinc-binding dehydrogenase [Deltaproteobacteria bacterium]MBW2420456.1 zinc-binding dehydrogenase [Deltaproteobacteria bacterium]
MRAVVYNGIRDLDVRDLPPPELQPDQVMVDVHACGICGSDLHLYREGIGPEICTFPYPGGRVLGHEFSGVISALGSAVEGRAIGDRVVGLGMGGMAEQVALHNAIAFAIPDGVSFDEAATAEPMSNSLRIVRKSNPQPGENVVVFGLGIIGLGVIQTYRALGVELGRLIAVDTSEYRRKVAAELGAGYLIDPKDGDVVEQVRELCGNRPSILDGDVPAVDVVCDCAGYIKGFEGKPVIQQALDMICDRSGRIMCFGMFEDRVSLDLGPLINRQPQLIGVMGMELEDVNQSLAWMAEGKIDRKSLVTHQFGLAQARDAFEAQTRYAESVKVVLHPQE